MVWTLQIESPKYLIKESKMKKTIKLMFKLFLLISSIISAFIWPVFLALVSATPNINFNDSPVMPLISALIFLFVIISLPLILWKINHPWKKLEQFMRLYSEVGIYVTVIQILTLLKNFVDLFTGESVDVPYRVVMIYSSESFLVSIMIVLVILIITRYFYRKRSI